MFSYIIWIGLSVAVGAYAKRKGRSGIGFFFLSFILSPIFGAIIVLLPTPSQQNKWSYLTFTAFLGGFLGYIGMSDNDNTYVEDKKSRNNQASVQSKTVTASDTTITISDFYVTASELNVRLSPAKTGKKTNVIYRRQLVQVFETTNGWSRISKYYDGTIEGVDGEVARWVSSKYLSKHKPTELRVMSSNRLEAALDSSDDYISYKAKFIKVSKDLINTGVCSVEDFEHQGGWVRSVNYKPRRVYFTYCGNHSNTSGRVYYEPSSGNVFK
ncbi:hypothetical protein BCT19_23450 [Vibrio splendidus]|uniref:SH3 domain-containing protein n=1 Tax=Vibrio splendidus TaxID=29497 RepID=UPI000C82985C|nr:SH3 domain-containing protein [Vibrio splendidus]PMO00210.1 hypothetical protein BCT19_23450 [Vibrio splendidus]